MRRRARTDWALVMVSMLAAPSFSALAACSDRTERTPDAGGDAAAAVDGGGTGADGGVVGGESYTVRFGPIDVAPGVERTQCVVVRVGNVSSMHVGRIDNVLGAASHHLIVYRVADETERTTPFDCDPFTDALDAAQGSPLMISQRASDTLVLPPNVGFELESDAMLRLEMHYVNATAETVAVEASSTLHALPPDPAIEPADFLFIGAIDISIPPRSTHSLGPVYFALPEEYEGAKFFAITGHQHKLGTGVRVSIAASAEDAGELVYAPMPFSWSEPETVYPDPAFVVPPGGGFRFSCTWENTGSTTVGFGESAGDEMCFFWAYYYPGIGPRVCIQSDEYGLAECCPGSSLCDVVDSF